MCLVHPCGVVFVTNCRPVEPLGRGVAGKRRTPEATVVVIGSAHRGHLCDYDKEVVMVTTIGIDPHKATPTAVAINETETVLGELTVLADQHQTKTLLDWAQNLDGGGRVWAVEAAGGLGYLLSQQLVAYGEHVVDVPPSARLSSQAVGIG